MDSDHLADLMRDSEENQDMLQGPSVDGNCSKKRSIASEDSQEMAIQEQIDDDEPTFYNDSTKIELQLKESTGQQGYEEPEVAINGKSVQEKMKRFVNLSMFTCLENL